MRGLYWLSKDLFDPELQGVMRGARALEQAGAQLSQGPRDAAASIRRRPNLGHVCGRLAYSIARDDLQAKTIHLYRLARAALIYLSLGIHREEERRRAGKTPGLIAPMMLYPWRDQHKL
ncbi:LA2681 family HEPN domain-containing protein [Bradyrhizobium sp. CCGB12]|nr:LA2681 family HEPN domain-containing protein [Bradyrhizobium sp. CCGB12]